MKLYKRFHTIYVFYPEYFKYRLTQAFMFIWVAIWAIPFAYSLLTGA